MTIFDPPPGLGACSRLGGCSVEGAEGSGPFASAPLKVSFIANKELRAEERMLEDRLGLANEDRRMIKVKDT